MRPNAGGEAQPARPEQLDPMPRLRVIGPGRFERGYLQRLSGLAAEVEVARERELRSRESLRHTTAALNVSRSVEHGCQRRLDRIETLLEQRTQALLASEQQQKRLALGLGALQRENEHLRAQLALAAPRQTALEIEQAPGAARAKNRARPGLLRRLFGSER